MCNLRGTQFCDPCQCDSYRGAVKRSVHTAAFREHRKAERLIREENEVYDREEKTLPEHLRGDWNRK